MNTEELNAELQVEVVRRLSALELAAAAGACREVGIGVVVSRM